MVLALYGNEYVALKIFVRHVPGRFRVVGQAADAKPLALPQGVVHQPHVLANNLAFRCFNDTRLSRQVLLQKITEAALTDKADPRGVFLACGDQIVTFGNGAYLGFLQLTQRKQGTPNGNFRYGVQEIALILVDINALEQPWTPGTYPLADIVAGSDFLGIEHLGILEK